MQTMERSAQDPKTIQAMFGQIAPKYDLANSVLSMGIHKLWRRKLVRQAALRPGCRVLDCATGTGDLAFAIEARIPGAKITGTDFCPEMLDVARQKARRAGSEIRFESADAMALPYADGVFDLASIAFGIRNTRNPEVALREMARVVTPGGEVVVLEFGQPEHGLMRTVYGLYSTIALPRLGGWVSGRPEAYRYLQASSAQFPCGEAFLEFARGTGRFDGFRSVPLSGGIAFLYFLRVSKPGAEGGRA